MDQVALAWARVFGREIGISDHFLDVGGDSLTAIELVHALADRGVELTIIDVSVAPTILSQAALVARLETDDHAPA